MKTPVRVCVCALLLIPSHPQEAFDLGGAVRGIVGGIGGAVGGVVGGALGVGGQVSGAGGGLVGGVLGLPGQLTFGPAIKDWEGANSRTVGKLGTTLDGNIDRLGKTLSGNITEVDTMLTKNILEVNQVLSNTTQDLDRVLLGTVFDLDESLKQAIDRLDESLTKNVGSLDTVAVKTAANFERMVRRLLLYGCVMVFLAFSIWQLYQQITKERGPLKRPLLQIAALFLALGSLAAVSSFFLPNQEDERALAHKHLVAYRESLNTFDFGRAVYHSSQLRVLDSTSPLYDAYATKVTLMRDILLRPATYASPLSRSQLAASFRRIQRYLREAKQPRDADVETLAAMVTWNAYPNRAGEYIAANICASAISYVHANRSPNDAAPFPLMPLAVHYVGMYLANPISDEMFALNFGVSREAENARLIREAGGHEDREVLQYLPLETIQTEFKWALETDKDARALYSATPHLEYPGAGPLDHILLMGAQARKLYHVAIPQYVAMVEASALASVQADNSDAQRRRLAARLAAAKAVIAAFDGFSASLSDTTLDGTNIRLTVLGGLHAIYSRAKMYEAAAERTGMASADNGTTNAVHRVWLEQYLPGTLEDVGRTSKAFNVIKNAGTMSFRRQENELITFETALHRLELMPLNDENRPKVGLEAARCAAQLGLVVPGDEPASGGQVVLFRVRPYAPVLIKKVISDSKGTNEEYRHSIVARSIPAA